MKKVSKLFILLAVVGLVGLTACEITDAPKPSPTLTFEVTNTPAALNGIDFAFISNDLWSPAGTDGTFTTGTTTASIAEFLFNSAVVGWGAGAEPGANFAFRVTEVGDDTVGYLLFSEYGNGSNNALIALDPVASNTISVDLGGVTPAGVTYDVPAANVTVR